MLLVITTDIISPPQSVNISQNGVAVFNCTFATGVYVWKAGDNQISSEGNRIFFGLTMPYGPANVSVSTLEVTASLDKNNTNITCTTFSSSPNLTFSRSEPALLLIQGTCTHTCTYM